MKNSLFVFAFVLSSLAQAGVESFISGSVTDEQGTPIEGATVELRASEKGESRTALSGKDGKFQVFPITYGEYQLSITKPDKGSYTSEIQVGAGASAPISASLSLTPASEMVLEVKGKKKLLQTTASVSSVQITEETIRQLPQGEQVKLPRLLSSTTPGIVQGTFGQLFVRGNHASVQYQIDGVQMPDSPSGTFGEAFSPRNIDHMEVITGGIPAEYGERLAAVVNAVTKSGAENPGGSLELNYGTFNRFSPQAMYGGSNASGDLHYFFSANYNRTDRGLDTPDPVSQDDQTQGGRDPIHDQAHGHNEFAKVDWQVDTSNKLTFTFFNSYNYYQIPNLPSSFTQASSYFDDNPNDPFGNTEGFVYRPSNTNDFQEEWNSYVQTVWKHTFSSTSFIQIAPYWKYSNLKVTNDLENDIMGGGSSFAVDRHTHNVGLKADFASRPNDQNLFKAGFQIQGTRSDGVVSVLTDDASSTNSDPNSGWMESAYVQDDFRLTQDLVLNLGLRFSATQFNLADSQPTDSLFQPRIGMNYSLTPTTQLHAFYGKLFQPAALENLRVTYSNLDPDHALAPYDIKAEKDDYYEFGVGQQFADSHVAQANVYYKNSVNIIDDAQLLNTSIAQPFNLAEGYAYGLELSVRGHLNSEWSDYFNYSYNIARGRGLSGGIFAFPDGEDLPGADYQFLDHIQVHTINSGVTYTKNHFWATVQGLYGSGLRTGPNNSKELPSHLTFDGTVGYAFTGKSALAQWKVSLDVLNMFNNVYPITLANGYNGSHYAAGREFFLHLTREL